MADFLNALGQVVGPNAGGLSIGFSYTFKTLLDYYAGGGERHREQVQAQTELEQLRQKGNSALQEGNHQHAEVMFEKARQKELQVIDLQFRNQIALAKHAAEMWQQNQQVPIELANFPLRLTPRQVYTLPETLVIITRHDVIPGLDNPSSTRVGTLDADLSSFLQTAGYRPTDPIYGTWFLEGGWKGQGLVGKTAVGALYSFLHERTTIFTEYQALQNELVFNVAHWGPGLKTFDYCTFARFPFRSAEADILHRRLFALQALVASGIADIYALLRTLAAPRLPGCLPTILGDATDEVITGAVSEILATYRSVLRDRAQTAPDTAVHRTLAVAHQLAQGYTETQAKPLLEHARHFLTTSLQMFLEYRGGDLRAARDVSALLNQAAALQLPQDDTYFSTAKRLRGKLERWAIDTRLDSAPLRLPEARGELTFEQRLYLACRALTQIRASVEALISQAPESLDGFGTVELLAILQESLDALKQPTFRIVPVGVTNGGKSTLGGALLGRALVPRGAGELSMGVLRFIHRPQGLTLREIWPPDDEEGKERIEEKAFLGDLMGLITHDAEVAEYLKRQMAEYKQTGYPAGKPFPSFEVETPLLLGNWREMFALPPGVGCEFRDVPGLNSTNNNDRNLAIIQDAIRGSFCVFVLDWNETAPDRAGLLLTQIRTMLEETGADPESVLFVLNKFDEWDKADDRSQVESRLAAFRQTLQEGLQLTEPPELIPMSGLLWFYGQAAWGPTALSGHPSAPPSVRETMLQALAVDSTKAITKLLDETDPRRRWYGEKFTPVLFGGRPPELSTEDCRYLLRDIVYPVSGAQQFCERMADRLRRRCASLVIRPLVIDALRKAESFLAATRKRFTDAQLDNTDKITSEIERIHHCTTALQQTMTDELGHFTELTTGTLEAIVSLGQQGQLDVALYTQWAERKVDLSVFTNIIGNLRKELADNLARPLLEFKAEQPIPAQWKAMLQEHRCQSLYQAANTYFRLLRVYGKSSSLRVEYAVQPTDSTGMTHIHNTERAYAALQQELVGAVTERSRFVIQQRLSALEEQAHGLLEGFYERIERTLKGFVQDDLLVQAIFAGRQPMTELTKEVPTSFRPVGDTSRQEQSRAVAEERTAVIRTTAKYVFVDPIRWLWRKTTQRSTADLFQTETKIVEVDKEHMVSLVPNGRGVEEDANQIFAKHADALQQALLAWLSDELLRKYAARLQQEAVSVLNSLRQALEAQNNKTSEELLHAIHQWAGMEEHLKAGRQELEQLRLSITDVASVATA
jgi:hypothetical protein